MENKEQQWYKMQTGKVLETLGVTEEGLSNNEALKRLEENGANKLKEGKKATNLKRFVDQFKNVMIIVLLISAIVSGIIGVSTGEGIADTLIILFVVIANAFLGMLQESKSEKAIEALQKLSLPYIKVKREGKVESIKTENLVVGDIVLLEAGDFVPADMRLIKVASIKSDEAALTGESVAVDKHADVLDTDEEVMLADRINMVYSGSSITYGRAEGVVVACGMDTELGKIAQELTREKIGLTPLQKKMDEISKMLSIIILVISVIMFVFGVLNGENYLSMFMLAVSLAVAAIPEGLPAVITITLAIGVQKMVKKHAIVRKLSAVEALGCTQIICSDKTGTLTQNKMTVVDVYLDNKTYKADEIPEEVKSSEQFKEYLNVLILCNDTKKSTSEGEQKLLGDPTETCLVTFSEKFDIIKEEMELSYGRVNEIPFDSDRKMMTTVNKFGNSYKVFVKGATESILNRCTMIYEDGVLREITTQDIDNIYEANKQKAKGAIRVLALAAKYISGDKGQYTSDDTEVDLVFIGLVGMIDPPRQEVKDAVKICFEAGMTPVMITGDNRDTAVAIAMELGIVEDESQVLTGLELDKMSDEDFVSIVHKYRVYARVSPEHKVKIVRAWKQNGMTVAMTGDGVNDAPALKAADIGVGMGITGTEVSKSVSSMILTDDNFATIVTAVKEGRIIYANIKKAIGYLLCSNLGEIVVLFLATMLFDFHILLPIHLLWINLVTDTIPALALGMEKAEKGIMKQKPRDSKNNFFDFDMSSYVITFGIIKGLIILGVAQFAYMNYPLQITSMTMTFLTLGLIELAFAFAARSERSLFKVGITSNKYLFGGIAFAVLLQVVVALTPTFRGWFRLTELTLSQWLIVVCASASILVVSEMYKLLQHLFNNKNGKVDKTKRLIPSLIMLIFIIISFFAYNYIMQNIENKHQSNTVDNKTVYNLIKKEDDITLIDVGETKTQGITNSVHVPCSLGVQKIEEKIPNIHSKVLLFDNDGSNTIKVAQVLDAEGYTRVYTMRKGMENFEYMQDLIKGEE